MMTLEQNKQNLYYSNQDKIVPVYETDDDGNIIYYEDSDGNKIPLETGETKVVYGEPIGFKGNIALSTSGEAQSVEYGLDMSSYSAVLILDKGLLPLKESSLIWCENEPKKDTDGYIDSESADYKIVKVSPSLNFDKYLLEKVVK